MAWRSQGRVYSRPKMDLRVSVQVASLAKYSTSQTSTATWQIEEERVKGLQVRDLFELLTLFCLQGLEIHSLKTRVHACSCCVAYYHAR